MSKETFELHDFIDEFEEEILEAVDVAAPRYNPRSSQISRYWLVVLAFLEHWDVNYRIIHIERGIFEAEGMDSLRR